MNLPRLLLVWLVGTAVAWLAGVVAALLTSLTEPGPVEPVVGAQMALSVVAVLLGVVAAVLLWAARPELAAQARRWHWLVVGLPVVVLTAMVGLVVRVAAFVPTTGQVLAAHAVELVLAAVVSLGLGTVLARWHGTARRRSPRRTPVRRPEVRH